MSLIEIFLLAFALSMDAFTVSVCKGLATKRLGVKQMCIAGAWFGVFQALMPSLGYLLGSTFEKYISRLDHWIAFILLALLGANMIREALSDEEEKVDASYSFKPMLLMAIATSIDALAAGITLSTLQVNIFLAAGLIGCTTFVISAVGVRVGNVFGSRFKRPAEVVGGVILILLGIKILLEHLGILVL